MLQKILLIHTRYVILLYLIAQNDLKPGKKGNSIISTLIAEYLARLQVLGDPTNAIVLARYF